MRQQHLESFRHVEIDRRRDVAQIARGGVDGAGQRLAVVDIERAAIVQHEVEIVIAAEGVVPRQPVDDHRRLVGDEGEAAADHRLVGAQHQLGVDDAFGLAGRAGGEQDFGDGVGSDFGMRRFDRRRRLRARQFREQRRRPIARRICGDRDFDAGRHRGGDGAGEGGAVGGEDEAGLKNLDDGFELAEILRQQRVRHRDRRIGNADMHGGKADERVLDIVAGKNGDRALRRQAARQERRGDGAHFRQCVRIGQRAPGARCVTLRQEHALGRGFRPMHQALGELLRECRQRMRRAQHDGAVAAALDHHVGRPEQDLPQRRLRRCLLRFCGGERHRSSCARLWDRVFPETLSSAPWPRRRLARSPR